MCTTEIRSCDGTESLLTCCVPDLKFDSFSIDLYILDFEINTNRCNKSRRKGIISISEKETGFTNTLRFSREHGIARVVEKTIGLEIEKKKIDDRFELTHYNDQTRCIVSTEPFFSE